MGTAIIESHLGGGKYRVQLQFDNAVIQQRITAIDARIAEITTKLAELTIEKATAKTKLDADVLALNVYIDATPPQEYAANPAQMNKLTTALYESKSAYDLIVSNENREKLQKTSLEKEKTYLTDNCPDQITADIWCVHRVTSLSGTIKTIECDYGLERDPDTDLIQFDTGCWLPAQATTPDSKLQHPFASSQHAVWYNLCVLPAAQRDSSRYRVATLLNVATGRIQFDGQFNTEEHTTRYFNKKPIFPVIAGAQREFYDGAVIRSLNPCGAELYQNNDRVIVDLDHPEFTAPKPPVVIGFYSNPRECVATPPINWPTLSFYVSVEQALIQYNQGPDNLYMVEALEGMGHVRYWNGSQYAYFELVNRRTITYKTLLNTPPGGSGGDPLPPDGSYSYTSGNFSAIVPALAEITIPAFSNSHPSPTHKLIGSKLFLLPNAFFPDGILFPNDVEIFNPPNYALPGTGVVQSSVTVNYSGPSGADSHAYTRGPVTGSHPNFFQLFGF